MLVAHSLVSLGPVSYSRLSSEEGADKLSEREVNRGCEDAVGSESQSMAGHQRAAKARKNASGPTAKWDVLLAPGATRPVGGASFSNHQHALMR